MMRINKVNRGILTAISLLLQTAAYGAGSSWRTIVPTTTVDETSFCIFAAVEGNPNPNSNCAVSKKGSERSAAIPGIEFNPDSRYRIKIETADSDGQELILMPDSIKHLVSSDPRVKEINIFNVTYTAKRQSFQLSFSQTIDSKGNLKRPNQLSVLMPLDQYEKIQASFWQLEHSIAEKVLEKKIDLASFPVAFYKLILGMKSPTANRLEPVTHEPNDPKFGNWSNVGVKYLKGILKSFSIEEQPAATRALASIDE